MVSYATVGSNNLKAARSFYDRLLGSIGIMPLFEHPSGGQVYSADGKMTFAVVGPYDGMPATAGNGTMIGFALGSPEAVNTFYALAVQLGGRDEGRPGKRGGAVCERLISVRYPPFSDVREPAFGSIAAVLGMINMMPC